ncbi:MULTISPECIES: spore germination protein [Bacillus]|uniref:spore germination protein n=1 Tax=Bacillus TaxID=1386 RepID=UPI000BB6B047|nr:MULTISPECIES: spore germination protein [Bacillus]
MSMYFKRLYSKKQDNKTNSLTQVLSVDLDKSLNIALIKKLTHDTDDLIIKEFNEEITLVYFASRVDHSELQKYILSPLAHHQSVEFLENTSLNKYAKTNDLNEAVEFLSLGKCLIIQDNNPIIIAIHVENVMKREVSEPINEQVIRGSHIGLIERISSNINIIRSNVHHPGMVVKYIKSDKNKTNDRIALLYIEELADKEVIIKVNNKLKNINTDNINYTYFNEELLENNTFSPFPQVLNTERVDRVVTNLLEGRIVLLIDGSPTAYILPITFFTFYQSPDDYQSRWIIGSFYRILRLMSFLIALSLPPLYIAVIAFHYEVVPGDLALTFKDSVQEIPYPPIVEAIILEITIELIREAGIRLPNPLGPTIGIVGGLVIGDAVVNAGLVSTLMIIVVALTAVASFAVPTYELSMSKRILRFPLMVAAACFGFIGIIIGFSIILIHLCQLESYGKPYLYPISPFDPKEFRDSIFRLPNWIIKDESSNK